MEWYDRVTDDSPIISCRVRLARNLKKYPFFSKLSNIPAKEMIDQVVTTVITNTDGYFNYTDITQKSDVEKLSLLERHKISLELVRSKYPGGILSSKDDTTHIMLNEEDHLRIQSISPGKNIREVFDRANEVDNLIEENFEYAFDENFGYLTACPSNVGTGMRASYMVHLPLLESSGKLSRVINALSSSGMTIRGIYGENSNPVGNIYQISNQITLGKSEDEIVSALENITDRIVQNELEMLDSHLKKQRLQFEDKVHRAYGLLTNCRQIDIKEAKNLLSTLRLGVMAKIFEFPMSIYTLMMNIEYGCLYLNVGSGLKKDMDEIRADYIREQLK